METALGAGLAAAIWVVKKVASHLATGTMKELAENLGVQPKIDALVDALQRANMLLDTAAGHPDRWKHNSALADAVKNFEIQAYDARDLLDELRYYKIKNEIEGTHRNNANLVKKAAKTVKHWHTTGTKKVKELLADSKEKITIREENDPRAMTHHVNVADDKNNKVEPDSDGEMWKLDVKGIPDRIEAITNELNKIYADVYNTLKLEFIAQRESKTAYQPVTGICSIETDGPWREQEKEEIKNKIIRQAVGKKLSVLPLVGDGGLGKTTLARQLCNDPVVKMHFEILIWIYVSVNFDEMKIMQDILEHLHEDGKNTKSTSFSVLQLSVKEKLADKRFLLVLDDMWEDKNKMRWEKLLAPLQHTSVDGNMILVTTRSLSTAKMIGTMEHATLKGMKDELFIKFFKSCISDDRNGQVDNRLMKIGERIAIKLNGNPLAARTVSTLLKRNINRDYWTRILNSEEWKFEKGANNIMPALRLSYYHLPGELQRCFSYCAIFPKGYKFSKEELVHTWIAQGFLMSENSRVSMEDIGSDVLYDLVDRSFFQYINEQQGEEYYLMHDLIHELAQNVSADECFTIDGSENDVPKYVRHASIITNSAYNEDRIRNERFEKRLEKIQNSRVLEYLSTLLLVGAYDANLAESLKDVTKKLKYVRVLRLSDVDALSNFSKLIHIRYLQLGCGKTGALRSQELSDAVCRFYLLQTLDLRSWTHVTDLPKGISNLRNLRHFLVPEIKGRKILHSKIAQVGKLTSLQELSEFAVGDDDKDFYIDQLADLENLRGSLDIYRLQNVKDKKEATYAGLSLKKNLRNLSLSWETSPTAGDTTEVLEGLEPNENLCHLTITNYTGNTPSWLGRTCSVTSLESLHLVNCEKWNSLPPPTDLPFLKKLWISDCPKMTSLSLCQQGYVDHVVKEVSEVLQTKV